MPPLNALAQLGVILLMFLIGAELAPGTLRRSGTRAAVVGHASMAPALPCGVLAAWALRSRFPSPQSGTLVFPLFIALCFAVTAFPVLARVLGEERLVRTRIGGLGIAAAGIGDITAWCLLALVVAAARQSSPATAGVALALVAGFAAVMFVAVRPLVALAVERIAGATPPGPGARGTLSALLVCLVLAGGLITNAMGVHSIFGAFLAGLEMPRDNPLIRDLTQRVEGVVFWVMLPLFFMTAGLQTDLNPLSASSWLICPRRDDELPRPDRADRASARSATRRARLGAVLYLRADDARDHGNDRRAAAPPAALRGTRRHRLRPVGRRAGVGAGVRG
ncbi:cation:proton antiporter [Actinospica sp.]|uniref:cation:proton antiporter domain-containing protein n=1 Tax=Actinospica sp. TaxID=1872142 RepID=UPI002BDC2187|nr:cation:proton antiporter [Actinospica sp.]HWG26471.1 cation:proton antiporter [Actinospica sp.]